MGRLGICSDGEAICALVFDAQDVRRDDVPVLLQAERELEEYFAGRRRHFSVPLCMRGTPFQMKVWRALQEIPFGETRSYGQLAAQVGSPKACRAVGMANNKNPLPIFVPCHRVIGIGGALTGYAGGLKTKKYLLELEGTDVKV